MAERKPSSTSEDEKNVKAPNLAERTKEEIQSVIHRDKSPPLRHHKETHGTSYDIDETTPVDGVKGPGVFQRMKEEVEAVVGSVHHKTDSS